MISARVGNLLELIEEFQLDGIMSAANGTGPMGRGIARAIRTHGGGEIQKDAFKRCEEQNPQEGKAYSTIAGSLEKRGIERIIHAVTMKKPGGKTSLTICGQAFKSALELAYLEGITRIGCTALGTGVGGLNSIDVAKVMLPIALLHEKNISIFFVDFCDVFIAQIQQQQ